jgi:hypothetical protein
MDILDIRMYTQPMLVHTCRRSRAGVSSYFWGWGQMGLLRSESGAENQVTPRSRVLLEKLIVTQLVKKFPPFMKPEWSIPCS